jgi:DNA polymerase
VQTHNLAKNSLPDLDLARELAAAGDFDTMQTLFGETAFVFSELIRTAFIPSDGCRFVVSDFAAIEARVISWISGEEWRLEAFRAGKDIYCETASMMYKVPVEKHGANSHLRQKGKVAELACGYQGGIGAMKRMDKGGTIPEEELQAVVDAWRAANPKIPKLWRTCELAAKTAIEEHRTVRIAHGIAFGYINGNLFIKLPSGRNLCYWDTRLKLDPRDGRDHIVYMGVNQETKQWGETETYGGKLVENIVQATARDCLAVAMTRVSELGYKIVMHVHDEMIVDVPNEDKEAPAVINDIMGQPIDWAPGLPLKGDTYETPFYMKD